MKKLQLYLCLLLFAIGHTMIAQNPFTTIIQSEEYRDFVSDQDIPTRDQVIADDLIVQSSLCVGFDCVNGEAFGFDTIRMKENNLRMHFDDTSASASFPNNDWRFTFNDSSNGGANYFSVDDATAGRQIFKVEAGAPSNALYVDDAGRVGIGTATPAVELHIPDGDTSTIRLEQDGTSGFTPQTWDIAGNETNFFIRDVTNGSLLPFRIRPGAPTSSIDISASGSIGIETGSPNANASLDLGSTTKGLQLNRMDTAARTALGTALGAGEVGVIIFDTEVGSMYTWDGTTWLATSGGTDNQALTLNINSLELEDGGTVDLTPFMDNTDAQNITGSGFAANMLTVGIENGTSEDIDLSSLDNSGTDDQAITLNVNSLDLEDGGSVDLTGYLDNTDDQAITLNVNSLDLEDGGTVDLSPYLDNTDTQNITGSGFAANILTVGIENGTSEDIDLSSLDNSGTDDQAITLNVNSLDLEDGGSVDLTPYLDNTDAQNISGSGFAANILTVGIENGTSEDINLSSLDNSGTDDQAITLNVNSLDLEDGGSVDLSPYLDNTDAQNISGSGFAANILTVGIENGTSEAVDLSSLDNSGTDDQALTLNTNSLDLEDGGSVDLSAYLDNTDAQNISGSGLAGNILTVGIENGASEAIDLSSLSDSGTDDQQLTITGNTLELENGGTVDLTGYLDNTDNQEIAILEFDSPNLKIEIEGGNVISVDISSLTSDLEDEIDSQQDQIQDLSLLVTILQGQVLDLIARMEIQEDCACDPLGIDDFNLQPDRAYLLQNVPNPFDNSTVIGYFIPLSYSKANIIISNINGQILNNINLSQFGDGSITVDKARMATATYLYTLYVDGKKVDTRRMIVE